MIELEPERDPCDPDPCGPYSQKQSKNGICSCSCLPNYISSPPTCRPECEVSSQCALDKACQNNRCIDPCPGSCGRNTHCQVVNHNAICSCVRGFTGNPVDGCTKIPSAPATTVRVPVDPCRPSPCGPNSACKRQGEVAACSCLPGFIDNPPNCRYVLHKNS